MKKILLLAGLMFSFMAVAQEQERAIPDSIPADLAEKIFMYNAAKQYNDPEVSRMALYSMLASNPNNVALRDTLALIYLQEQKYASAALVSQDVVSVVPSDMFAAEIAAVSFERLGVKAKALTYYEKLYTNNSDDIDKLYKIAFLQLDLKQFEAAALSAQQLSEHKLASETKLIFPKDDGSNQEVTMRLAALRFKALVEEDRGNKDEAKAILDQILSEMPDFQVAQKQLAELNK